MASSASRRMAHATHATQRWGGEVSFSRTLFPPPSHLIIPPCQIITCKMTIVIVNSKTFDNDPISTCRLATREGERHELRIDYSAHYRPPPDSCSWLAPSCQGWRPYTTYCEPQKKKTSEGKKRRKTGPQWTALRGWGPRAQPGKPGKPTDQNQTKEPPHATTSKGHPADRVSPGGGQGGGFLLPSRIPSAAASIRDIASCARPMATRQQ